jgi:hypothetical protein
MYGANNLVWSGVQNATIGTIYTTEYGFKTSSISAAYAGGVLGTIIGGLYVGTVSKILTLRLARRNNGISEPEHTLYVFIASIVLVPVALVLYGCAVTYHWHWFALAFTQFCKRPKDTTQRNVRAATLTTILRSIGIALNGTICVSAALSYAINSYPELSGQMVTTCVLIRNTLSFAINFGITPWLKSSNYLTVYCIMAGIGFVWNASLFVMTRYGRKIRESTAARYWRDVERARSQGLGH